MVPFLIEPVHEMLLQPGQCLPFRRSAVREAEIAEHALEIRLVEIADVPEYRLIAAVACRHIHRVHNLLEVIVNDFFQGSLFGVAFDHFTESVEVVFTVVLPDEIIHIHKELRCSHGSHELG